ncbi:MAG: molecular chaperone [Oscillospiraceae bacterium]
MKLTKIEQESIVLFNEAESTAEIYTHNVKLKNKLRRFAEKHPGIFLSDSETGGAMIVTMPKSLLTIGIRAPISEAERQVRRKRAKENSPLLKLERSAAM